MVQSNKFKAMEYHGNGKVAYVVNAVGELEHSIVLGGGLSLGGSLHNSGRQAGAAAGLHRGSEAHSGDGGLAREAWAAET